MKFKKVFEDYDVLVIDKPAGLVVNRSQTTNYETLQDQLEKYFKLADLGVGDRAGIVHRLDRETSGLMVIAKKERVSKFLQKQFKERQVRKEYTALVHGEIKDDRRVVDEKIGRVGKFGKFGVVKDGREAETELEVVKRLWFKAEKLDNLVTENNFNKNRIRYLKSNAMKYTLLKVKPKTGRTHQIRVHVKSVSHPIVSDSIYTPGKLLKFDNIWCPRLFLHASYLEFRVGKSKGSMKYDSDLPKELKSAILNLS